MSVAFVFPGQGSQAPGMGKELHDALPESRAIFEEIDGALDHPLSRTCFEGTAEELAQTETTQPAILAVSVAAWRALDARGIRPAHVAGHSLGEWSALVAAGVMTAGDAARTVRRRGRYMQEAVASGVGAMAAIIGGTPSAIEEACRAASAGDEIVSPANFNSPEQVVIAGHAAAVDRAITECVARGARKGMKLKVSAPFHCALMEPAARRLAADLDGLTMSPFRMPLVANVTAREVSDPEIERGLLVRQVTAPVRWQECVERLVALGTTTFVEIGPGKVLTGLVKRIAPEARLLNVASPAEVDQAAQAISAG